MRRRCDVLQPSSCPVCAGVLCARADLYHCILLLRGSNDWPLTAAGVLGLVSWPSTIENRVDTWVETGVEVSGEPCKLRALGACADMIE